MTQKSKKARTKLTTVKLHDAVMQYITQPEAGTFNYRNIAEALGLTTPAAMRSIALFLAELAFDGELTSKPSNGGRENCDIVYIGEPLE